MGKKKVILNARKIKKRLSSKYFEIDESEEEYQAQMKAAKEIMSQYAPALKALANK